MCVLLCSPFLYGSSTSFSVMLTFTHPFHFFYHSSSYTYVIRLYYYSFRFTTLLHSPLLFPSYTFLYSLSYSTTFLSILFLSLHYLFCPLSLIRIFPSFLITSFPFPTPLSNIFLHITFCMLHVFLRPDSSFPHSFFFPFACSSPSFLISFALLLLYSFTPLLSSPFS